MNTSPPVVSAVVEQHADEAAMLHDLRSILSSAPYSRLKDLSRFDNRIDANLEGVAINGEACWSVLAAALARAEAAPVFTAAIFAIETRSNEVLDNLGALAEANAAARDGLISAFGWVEQRKLRGIVKSLLASSNDFRRYLGICACGVQRVDPGKALEAALVSGHLLLRARALRSVGELGRCDLLPECLRLLASGDPACDYWAARSAILLGDRNAALHALMKTAAVSGQRQEAAFRLAIQAMPQQRAREWLGTLAKTPGNIRLLLQGVGIYGDPQQVPWLIDHMTEAETGRLAADAFSLLTGLDLSSLGLVATGGIAVSDGLNDDPDDPHVELEQDHGLPWPDPDKISRWWQSNSGGFAANTRYFMGTPLSREHCVRALKEGFQRQRILAAHYLCLLEPGTVLFEWRAPARRQQRLLANMA